jgi:hypothetical protein
MTTTAVAAVVVYSLPCTERIGRRRAGVTEFSPVRQRSSPAYLGISTEPMM